MNATTNKMFIYFDRFPPDDNKIPIADFCSATANSGFKTTPTEIKNMKVMGLIPDGTISDDGKEISLWALLQVVVYQLNKQRKIIEADLSNPLFVSEKEAKINEQNLKAKKHEADVARISRDMVRMKVFESAISDFGKILSEAIADAPDDVKDDYAMRLNNIVKNAYKKNK